MGDQKYKLTNSNKGINKNLMLHSYQIKFMINNKKNTYTALLPDYFKKLLKIKDLNFQILNKIIYNFITYFIIVLTLLLI